MRRNIASLRTLHTASGRSTAGSTPSPLPHISQLCTRSYHDTSEGYEQPQSAPSLHLPPYFELKELGNNFRYKTDPSWVIDVIQKDCVREEGLTYVAEAATYSVTFFQLVNYCAKRGYEVSAYGVQEASGNARGSRRWAVLHSKELQSLHMSSAAPPMQADPYNSNRTSQHEIAKGIENGKYLKWNDEVVPTERRMKAEDMVFYDVAENAPVAAGAVDAEVVVQGDKGVVESSSSSLGAFAAEVHARAEENLTERMRDVVADDSLERTREGRNVTGRYMVCRGKGLGGGDNV